MKFFEEIKYEATFEDLRNAGLRAKETLKKEGLAHIVYALTSAKTGETFIRDYDPEKFKTDEEFERYVEFIGKDASLIYAIHAQN